MKKYVSSVTINKVKTLLIVSLGISSLAHADTATTTFTVTASILKACAVTATPMAFGTYNPASGTPLAATSTITTTCTATTSYTTGLNAGTSVGATVTTRKMTGTVPANLLPYGLYQNAAHTTNWGNTPGTDTPAAVVGTGLPQNATVYGQIAASVYAPIDSYLDTITVTVTY